MPPSSTGIDAARRQEVGTLPAAFLDYYRCADGFASFELARESALSPGFFTFRDVVCFGRLTETPTASTVEGALPDASDSVICEGDRICLPFDLTEIVRNLQQERYHQSAEYLQRLTSSSVSQSLYYFLRPLLPVAVRRHLQKVRLSGWERIPFPGWPVDFSVDTLMERAMGLVLQSSGHSAVPFIWFWPDGASSCAMMTHDVETAAGRDFCDALMDLDDSYGIKSSFQLVPEGRYDVSAALLERMRSRGFEVNVHDLNHDGRLFLDRGEFQRRVARINGHARRFQSRGFRSGAMYRQQQWFDALDVSYDMSVPNVAHLEPQRGGCCTVMPYFAGRILELPLTTIQDYSLFHILGMYALDLWRQQIDLIRARHGLISFITHPDYLMEANARETYRMLLAHLRALRQDGHIWFVLPGAINDWWRNRSQMTLVNSGGTWRVEGPESHRARVAHAVFENDRVVYRLQDSV
jgi:hypothetical protein